MANNQAINVKGTEIITIQKGQGILFTDMVKGFEERALYSLKGGLETKTQLQFIEI